MFFKTLTARHSLLAAALFLSVLQTPASAIFSQQSYSTDGVITATGLVSPMRSVEYKNETERDLVILQIVQDGMQVEKDDLLIEFDTSMLNEELKVAEIELATSLEALQQLQKRMEQAKSRFEREEAVLSSTQEIIERNKKYEFGEKGRFELMIKELEQTVQQEKLELNQKDSNETVANDRLQLVREQLIPLRRAQLDLQLLEVQSKLQSLTDDFDIQQRQLTKQLASTTQYTDFDRDRVRQLRHMVRGCRVKTVQSGVVHWATIPSEYDDFNVLEEGTVIRPKQTVLFSADPGKWIVELELPEELIGTIVVGQPATVKHVDVGGVDHQEKAKVVQVDSLPKFNRITGSKQYRVLIEFSDAATDIRIGSNCEVTIESN